jgi:hypothetical protein
MDCIQFWSQQKMNAYLADTVRACAINNNNLISGDFMKNQAREVLWRKMVRSILAEARRESSAESYDEIDAIVDILDGRANAASAGANGFNAIKFARKGGIFLSEQQREQINNTIRMLEQQAAEKSKHGNDASVTPASPAQETEQVMDDNFSPSSGASNLSQRKNEVWAMTTSGPLALMWQRYFPEDDIKSIVAIVYFDDCDKRWKGMALGDGHPTVSKELLSEAIRETADNIKTKFLVIHDLFCELIQGD